MIICTEIFYSLWHSYGVEVIVIFSILLCDCVQELIFGSSTSKKENNYVVCFHKHHHDNSLPFSSVRVERQLKHIKRYHHKVLILLYTNNTFPVHDTHTLAPFARKHFVWSLLHPLSQRTALFTRLYYIYIEVPPRRLPHGLRLPEGGQGSFPSVLHHQISVQ